MANFNLVTSFLFMLCVDAMLLFAQYAVADINPDQPSFWHPTGSVLNEFDQAGNYTLNSSSYSNYLPSSQGTGVVTDEGFSLVDTFTTLRNWATTFSKILLGFLAGPYFILMAVGFPQIICFTIGGIWFITNLILVIAFITGR